MNIDFFLTVAIYSLFILHFVKVLLFEVFLWQLKEYRWDRIKAHLFTNQGKKLLFNKLAAVKLLILIFSAFFLRKHVEFLVFSTVVFALYFIEFVYIIRLGKKTFVIPRLTIKSVLILVMSSLLLFVFAFIFTLSPVLLVLVLDRILPLVIFISVVIFNIPTSLAKNILVFLARRKIAKLKNLLVIGITGSYGKTSTKEFVFSLLSEKYIVLKTKGSQNTQIAVALTVLKDLKPKHQVLVIEMAAYRRGEIKRICEIVSPDIGVVTGIGLQHVELFGGLKKLLQAKFELVENVKKDGLTIFNVKGGDVSKMIDWTVERRKDLKIWCVRRLSSDVSEDCLQEKSLKGNVVYIKNILADDKKVSFDLVFQDRKINCQALLLGEQQVENIALACTVCLNLGFRLTDLPPLIKKLKQVENTLRVFNGPFSSTFIDDTFNASFSGTKAAIKAMSLFEGKKILVLTPLIELGKYAKNIHFDLGRLAAEICDIIFLTNPNYRDDFIAGVEKTSKDKKKVFLLDDAGTTVNIKGNIKTSKKSVVLFEGKQAKKILDLLKTYV